MPNLLAYAESHQDASTLKTSNVYHLVPQEGFKSKPLVWRLKWPQYIIDLLFTSKNPNRKISNSDLELAGGLLHLDALARSFNTRERIILGKTDNLNTLWWQQKGCSATTTKVPAHPLPPLAIWHSPTVPSLCLKRRLHVWPSNPIMDALSWEFDMVWNDLSRNLVPYLPLHPGHQI